MTAPTEKTNVEWHWLPFKNLSVDQLDDIYRLRQTVFIVEQNCPYLDADGEDKNAIHLMGSISRGEKHELVATLRLFPKFVDDDSQIIIGRVCTAKSMRKFGIGRAMMEQAIDFVKINFPGHPIQISAQSYLNNFYSSLGFVQNSKEYLEDNIPHIGMRLELKDTQ